jgi:hypothetical protein
MSHSQLYREAFIEGQIIINITADICIMTSTADGHLDIDSYDTPKNVWLCIKNNISEDIEFNGMVLVCENVENYGRIVCKHVYFSEHSCCRLDRIVADTVDTDILAEIIFAPNANLLGFIGVMENIDSRSYFPNLLITSQFCNVEAELACFYIGEENGFLLLDKTHYYYGAVEYLEQEYRPSIHNKNSVMMPIDIDENTNFTDFAGILIDMVASIKAYRQPLLKNAYNN